MKNDFLFNFYTYSITQKKYLPVARNQKQVSNEIQEVSSDVNGPGLDNNTSEASGQAITAENVPLAADKPEFNSHLNILTKDEYGAFYVLELIDGDHFTAQEIRTRLERNGQALNQKGSSAYVYFIEFFVFDRQPDPEKLSVIKELQVHNPYQKSFLKCMAMNLETEKFEKYYKAPVGNFGLEKIAVSALSGQTNRNELQSAAEAHIESQKNALTLPLHAKIPVLTYILIGINILVWLFITIYAFTSGSSYSALLSVFGAKENPAIISGEYWRLITPVFLHLNIVHLLINCYSLFAVGVLTERIYGHWRFALIYLFAGFMGCIASFNFSLSLSVGASGAIFGLLGALLYIGVERPALFRACFGSGVIITIVINIAYGIMKPGIDNFGHIGGLIGGFLAAGIAYFSSQEGISVKKAAISAAALCITCAGLFFGFSNSNNIAWANIIKIDSLIDSSDVKTAEQLGLSALKANPTNKNIAIDLYRRMIRVEALQDKYDSALDYALKLQEINAADGHYMAGLVYFDTQQYEKSKSELLKAKSLKANYSNIDELISEINKTKK